MPSPIAHSLTGCLLARHVANGYFDKPWKLALFCAVLANLPDFDYLIGIVQGYPNLHHRLYSHSLGFAVLVGLLCGGYFKARGNRFWPMFCLSSGACFSHVVLDFLGADTSPPHGVTALWPFSSEYFISPVPIFSTLKKGDTLHDLLGSVFKLHNILALVREVVIFTLLLALQNWLMKNRLALETLLKSFTPRRRDAKNTQSVLEIEQVE